VAAHLTQLFSHLLQPIGVTERPSDISQAIDPFVGRR